MTYAAESTRRFRVYAKHVDAHHARLIEETSFEGAAVAYLEGFHLPAPVDEGEAYRVIVHDVQTGREHCFRLDLDTGETTPCG
jgi:hypothetical protein